MRYTFFLLLTFIGLTAIAQENKSREILDYSVQFSGTKAEGSISGLSGAIIFNEEDPTSAYFDVQLDPGSISTGNDTKNKHARSENWLDVDTYPKIRFRSNTVSLQADSYVAEGILDFHGMEKQESIVFTAVKEGKNTKLVGKMTVDRQEYDISGSLFGFVVGDEFEVDIEVLIR